MPPSHCLVKICSWQLISQFFTLCSCCFSPCFLLRPFAQQKQWPRIIVWNKKRICILDSLEQRPPLYAVDFCLSLGGNTGRDTAPGATAKATIIFCWALTEESRDQQVISKLGRQPGDIDKKPKHKCSRCESTLNECPQRLAACHRQKLILKTIFYDSIAPPLAPLCIPYAKGGDWIGLTDDLKFWPFCWHAHSCLFPACWTWLCGCVFWCLVTFCLYSRMPRIREADFSWRREADEVPALL